jgi:hypothetical protein
MIKRLNDITNIYRSSNSLTKVYRGVNLVWNSVVPIIWDTDALNYISRVETADGESLEEDYKVAYNDFVLELKTESLWDSLTDIAPMVGARTFAGGLTKLKRSDGFEMTSVNMDTVGTYDRQNGFTGDGVDDYINTHSPWDYPVTPSTSIWVTSQDDPNTGIRCFIGMVTSSLAVCDSTDADVNFYRIKTNNALSLPSPSTGGFIGGNATVTGSTDMNIRQGGVTYPHTMFILGATNHDVWLFRRYNGNYSASTLKGFSYGTTTAPDMVKLETAFSNLFTTIDALI